MKSKDQTLLEEAYSKNSKVDIFLKALVRHLWEHGGVDWPIEYIRRTLYDIIAHGDGDSVLARDTKHLNNYWNDAMSWQIDKRD